MDESDERATFMLAEYGTTSEWLIGNVSEALDLISKLKDRVIYHHETITLEDLDGIEQALSEKRK